MARGTLPIRGSIVALFLLASAGLPHAALAGELCADLQRLQNAQPGFADLRGAPAPDDKWHVTPPDLGGVGTCLLSRSPRYANVTCTSAWIDDAAAAKAKAAGLVQAVQQCLGPEWRQTTGDLGTSQTTGFLNGASPLIFSVLRYQTMQPPIRWQVWLGAMMPEKREKQAVPQPKPADIVLGWREESSWCDDLKKVAAAAAGKFASIKGRPSGSRWLPTQSVAGMNGCRIGTIESLDYFTCKATQGDSETEARTVFDALAADLKVCLPPPWIRQSRRNREGLPVVSHVNPSVPGTVEVRMSESDGAYSVRLDVDAD